MIVNRVELGEIQSMRDIYRHEMHCQIMFDSIHVRPGWTHEYLITEGESKLGYGSVAVAGPWQAKPTVYEFFVLPQHRTRIFDAFVAFLRSSGATAIETQSNAGLPFSRDGQTVASGSGNLFLWDVNEGKQKQSGPWIRILAAAPILPSACCDYLRRASSLFRGRSLPSWGSFVRFVRRLAGPPADLVQFHTDLPDG